MDPPSGHHRYASREVLLGAVDEGHNRGSKRLLILALVLLQEAQANECVDVRSSRMHCLFLPCQPRRAMSAIGGKPADMCSLRGFLILTHSGHNAVRTGETRAAPMRAPTPRRVIAAHFFLPTVFSINQLFASSHQAHNCFVASLAPSASAPSLAQAICG
jgi:hypothetical protein